MVGLPSGSQHELGALAFATAIRRGGLNVLYLGANVPARSWDRAVTSHAARAAVLAVPTDEDRPAAISIAELLADINSAPLSAQGAQRGQTSLKAFVNSRQASEKQPKRWND